MTIIEILQYGFIQKALLAGAFISILCATLGLFLVLRRLSLIGDGLSHVSFGAVAIGLFFGVYPLYIAVPIVIFASLLILYLMEKAKLYGDTAIGIVSSVSVATGIIIASVSGGFNVDLFSYLFGNILAISNFELILSVVLSVVVLIMLYLFYFDLFSLSFSSELAQISGIKIKYINSLLVMLTAITVVLSVRIVGVMLISALLIIPAVSAIQVARSFIQAVFLGSISALISLLIGIYFSFVYNVPTGAMIVLCNFVFFVGVMIVKKILRR